MLFVCPPKFLHKYCFCFLFGPLLFPRETGSNAYAKFGGTNKEYYGIFRSGLLAYFAFSQLGGDKALEARSTNKDKRENVPLRGRREYFTA